jgi:phosphohistidine phosphatase SixA
MRLHIIRHAEAIERSTDLPDEQRHLTCCGRKRFRKVAACLKKMAIAPDYILASPLVRAVQTAEGLRGVSGNYPEEIRPQRCIDLHDQRIGQGDP